MSSTSDHSQSHADGIAAGEQIAFPLRRVWQAAASPGVWGPTRLVKWQDRLFVGDNAHGDDRATLSCIHAVTGEVSWRHTHDLPGRSALGAVTPEAVVFYRANWGGPVAAYDHADGRRLWTNEHIKPSFDRAVVLRHTIVMDGGGSDASQAIVSLDLRDGAIIWSRQYGGITNVELAVNDAIVLVRDQAKDFRSLVMLVSGTTGEVLWQRDLRETHRSLGLLDNVWRPGYINSVMTDGERLYLNLRGATLLALDAASGEPLWQDEGEGVTSAVINVGGRILFMRMSTFHCLDAATGAPVWVDDLPSDESPMHTSGFVADGKYFYAVGGSLIVRDLQTRQIVWRFDADDHVMFPFVADGRLYFGTFDGFIHCFEPE